MLNQKLSTNEIDSIHNRNDWNSIQKFWFIIYKVCPWHLWINPFWWVWWMIISTILVFNEFFGYDVFSNTYKNKK